MLIVTPRPLGIALLAIAIAGCAPAREPVAATVTAPAGAPPQRDGGSGEPTGDRATHRPAEPRRPLDDAGACPLRWEPREVGSVLRIPAGVMARAMDRVVLAACRCVRPGEAAHIVADIDFTEGRAVASANDAPEIARCLDDIPVLFEPWKVEGLSDCIGCGPRRFGVLRGSPPVDAPGEERKLRVVLPWRVDRTGESRAGGANRATGARRRASRQLGRASPRDAGAHQTGQLRLRRRVRGLAA